MSLSPGQRIDRYQIEALLGSGGMGSVYRALDSKLDRTVAIKTLPVELAEHGDRLRRFDREARCASSLNHPNVVTIHDVGHAEGLPFIVMEHVEGSTFQELVQKKGPLDAEVALGLSAQAAQGLSKAHAVGIVHRDLKPANLMRTNDGVVKILDFGLAKLLQTFRSPSAHTRTTEVQPSQVTGAHVVMGTPHFMSPEQAQGLPIDHRTDIWSLGAVLCFVLTGSPPFRGDSMVDLMYAVVHQEPEVLSTDALDEPLRRILSHALAKDPRERYASAADMLADLEHPSGAFVPRFGTPGSEGFDLPTRLTSFVGREEEIAEVSRALQSTRLLTLTGPGGTGKTSLAVEACRRLGSDFLDGATFVSLASVSSSKSLWRAVAVALKLDVKTGNEEQDVTEHLHAKGFLLVLDNFEHLLDGAVSVARLLRATSGLKVVVTTRVPLHVEGELVHTVPPLVLPPQRAGREEILASEAVQLFLQRSRAVQPRFEPSTDELATVADICRRLDGLPLALELAAARTRLLPPKALLPRLGKRLDLLTAGSRDQPERHQTLRAAIDWSYELLDDSEQLLFRRLCGCAGGVTLEAVEAIVRDLGGDAEAVLDGVASLLDKSLLRREEQDNGEPRLLLLETIREFGSEQLALHGEEKSFREAHSGYYLDLCERAAPHLTGPEAKQWLDRLSLDYENLRLALGWFDRSSERIPDGLRMGVALWRYWLARGPLKEGSDCLERLVSKLPPGEQRELRAKALAAAGSLRQNIGEFAEGKRMLEESLAIQREVATPEETAATVLHLGWVYWRYGDFARTRELSEEGLRIHRKSGNDLGVATAMNSLGITALFQGEYPEARRTLTEVAELFRSQGDARRESFALTNLGIVLHRQGESEKGLRLVERAVELSEEMSELQYHAYALRCVAEIAFERGDFERAAHLARNECLPRAEKIGEVSVARVLSLLGGAELWRGNLDEAEKVYDRCLASRRRIGDKWGVAEALHGVGCLARARGKLRSAGSAFRESLSLQLQMSNKQGLVDALEELGGLAVTIRDARGAARLFGAAEAIREEVGAVVPPRLRRRLEGELETAREALGRRSFDALREEGRGLDYAGAVDLALSMSWDPAAESPTTE